MAAGGASTPGGTAARLARYRWVVIVNLWLHQQAALTVSSGLGVLLPALEEDLGLTPETAGWLGASRYLGPVVLTLPASVYLARTRSPQVYAALLGASGLLAMATAFSPTAALLIAGMALYATAAMLVQVPQARVRLHWVGPNEFALVMGLTLGLSAAGQSTGIVAIPYLLPLVGGWRGIFLVMGGFTLLLALLWPLVLRAGRGREVPRPVEPPEPVAPSLRGTLGRALRRREFTLVGLALMANAGGWAGFQLFLPSYLHEHRGMALPVVGIIAGVMPLGGVLGTVLGGWLSDRMGLRRPAIWPLALAQPLLYLLLLAPFPAWLLAAVGFLVGLGVWAPGSALLTIAHEVPGASEDDIVVGQGIVRTIMTVGNLALPAAIGVAAGLAGSLQWSLAAVSLLPLAVVALGWVLPETGPAARRPVRAAALEAAGEP